MNKQFKHNGHIIELVRGMYHVSIGDDHYCGSRIFGAQTFIDNHSNSNTK